MINVGFSEDFHLSSLSRFQEINTSNTGVQDFEGIVPGETYWGLKKINEEGCVTINLGDAPISQLTSWNLVMRLKKAADGEVSGRELSKSAHIGLLCVPVGDLPTSADLTASVGVSLLGVNGSSAFAFLDGTLDNFGDLEIYVPPAAATFKPFTLPEIPAVPNLPTASASSLASKIPKTPAAFAAINDKSILESASAMAGSAISNLISSLANNPAVSKITSMVGMVKAVSSTFLPTETVESVRNSASALSSRVTSLATSNASAAMDRLKSAKEANLPITPELSKASMSSPELSKAASEISQTTVSIKPEVPAIKPSATSSPFYVIEISYNGITGMITININGIEAYKFGRSNELKVALQNKHFVIGCITENLRIQVDSISFSGVGQ